MNQTFTFSVIALVLCAALSSAAQSRHIEPPFLVNVNEKYGFMDANCRLVIPSQYAEAFDFTEGLAAVKIGGKWGYINHTGAVVIPAQFAGAFHFSDGLASVRLTENSPLWGFIDKNGKMVIQPQFGMPLWFSEGLVEGYGERGGILNIPLGYVDKAGSYTVQLHESGMEIEFLTSFSDGLAAVSMRPKHSDGSVGPSTWGYVDHHGSWVIPRSFAAVGAFRQGLAPASRQDSAWGYIDKTGQFVIPPRFETAGEFSEGLAAVRVAGRWHWIDSNGQVVIDPKLQADEVGEFRSGMTTVVRHGKLGYMSKTGDLVVPPSLDWGTEFVDGAVAISDASGMAIIDTTGKIVCRLKP